MMSGVERGIAVQCRGVTKHYGSGVAEVVALRGVDLDVRVGELLMLVGPSGCGKTTLISIISAILDQDEGECEVLGYDLHAMPSEKRVGFRGKSIGFVFQLFNLLPALTALENVAVPLLLAGVPRKRAMARASDVLMEVGLEGRGSALPMQLSGGQQQRVAIARALVHDPRLIICDEPTSNLDHKAGHEMLTLLRRVAQRPHRSLLIVTHDQRIYGFADRIAHMEDGRIVGVSQGGVGEAMS